MKRAWTRFRIQISCGLTMFALIDIGCATDRLVGTRALPITLGFWGLATVPIAISFYAIRRKTRLIYGLFELIVGFGILYFLMLNIIQVASAPISLEPIVGRMLAIFAAIYFMVRALDNIGEGFAVGSAAEKRWNTIFPKTSK